ncbi:hypothetical protein PEDI_35130 [Persicobacter diffluens]|uniref:Uncharacterized protein n=1 Tax=Persicobacter diffluens TaxID=981 RepID=A0AAN4VZL2_9BACT|nr:hypothetical protein PEDI_35130 [Persicobacter diffluens]
MVANAGMNPPLTRTKKAAFPEHVQEKQLMTFDHFMFRAGQFLHLTAPVFRRRKTYRFFAGLITMALIACAGNWALIS